MNGAWPPETLSGTVSVPAIWSLAGHVPSIVSAGAVTGKEHSWLFEAFKASVTVTVKEAVVPAASEGASPETLAFEIESQAGCPERVYEYGGWPPVAGKD